MLCITATPSGTTPLVSDQVISLPAQTVATDQDDGVNSLAYGIIIRGADVYILRTSCVELKSAFPDGTGSDA